MDEHTTFDEVAAAKEILVELRRRRQRLQLREARQGDNTGPEVIGEIEELTTRITGQETELQQLETRAAVDKWSLSEATYRELLADTWGTERGCPTIVGSERLERVRPIWGSSVSVPRSLNWISARSLRRKSSERSTQRRSKAC